MMSGMVTTGHSAMLFATLQVVSTGVLAYAAGTKCEQTGGEHWQCI